MLLLCQLEAARRRVAVDRDGPRAGRSSAGGDGGRGVGLEEVPDAASEVALEAADGVAAGLALGLPAREVGGRFGVQAAFGDREAMQGAVELAVAAAVEAVALGSSGGCGDRCRAGGAGELGVAGEAGDAGDLAEQLGGGQDAAAAFGQQSRRERGDERGELGFEVVDGAGEFADAA
jgi:hypothetical protein